MIGKDIPYEIEGKTFTGYLADDESRGPGRRPGILVCHQGGGLREHTRERANLLAGLGYVAFALDMYGETPMSIEAAMTHMQALVKDQPELRKRAQAGLDVLKTQVNVDPERLAAVGYCFGGALVLEMARSASELKCVVAFHPGMSGVVPLPDKDDRPVHAKVMVCAGADDPYVPQESRVKFAELMNAAGADWQLFIYGGAVHSFTDRAVDAMNMPAFKYHERTDRRSWAAMRQLFDETFGPL
ncbi:MAG TPA: dienelactone hydrolase family protein [Rhizomicrobium sp.]